MQALDSNGNTSGDPLDVTPDIDVQTFLAGQGSLTDIGKLTGPGLVAPRSRRTPITRPARRRRCSRS